MVTGEKRRLSNKVEKITEYLIIWTFQNHWIFEHILKSPPRPDEEAITMIGMMINWSCAQEVTVVLKKGFRNTVHLYLISNTNSYFDFAFLRAISANHFCFLEKSQGNCSFQYAILDIKFTSLHRFHDKHLSKTLIEP